MFSFRPFSNADPPQLARIWCSQPPHPRLLQPMTVGLLEEHIFSRPHFDRRSLIVAHREGHAVGFVHAGFGADSDRRHMCRDMGVICMLMVEQQMDETDRDQLALELLARGESYLRSQGAQVIYGGGIQPLNPFYLGLYGGSELPGIVESDAWRCAAFRRAGYSEMDRVCILRRDLGQFHRIVDRRQRMLARRMAVNVTVDPAARDWWEALTQGDLVRTRFELAPADQVTPPAVCTFWNMRPLSDAWSAPAWGLLDVFVESSWRRQGMATFLLGKAMRALQEEGITRIEAQTMQHNTEAREMYRKLGFDSQDEGIVFRRDR